MSLVSNYKKKLESENGAAMLEMAISFLPFIIVIMGTFAILRLAFIYATVEFMANEVSTIITAGASDLNLTPDQKLTAKRVTMFNKLVGLSGGDKGNISLSVGINSVCSPTSAVLISDGNGNPTTAFNTINFGQPRDIVSVCVTQSIAVLPLNLKNAGIADITNLNIRGMSIGRNEPLS